MRLALLVLALSLGGCSILDPNYIAAEGKTISPAAPGTGAARPPAAGLRSH